MILFLMFFGFIMWWLLVDATHVLEGRRLVVELDTLEPLLPESNPFEEWDRAFLEQTGYAVSWVRRESVLLD